MISADWDEATRQAIQRLAEVDGFVVSSTGTIRWTAPGLARMRERFTKVGVDIRTLTSFSAYLNARATLSDAFVAEISQKARAGQKSTQRDLLIAIVEGESEQAKQLEFRLRQRSKDSE